MANGVRKPAQRPERHLRLGGRFAGLVAEQRKPILDILVSRRHDKLENRPAAFPVGHQPQAAFLFVLLPDEGQQRLLLAAAQKRG